MVGTTAALRGTRSAQHLAMAVVVLAALVLAVWFSLGMFSLPALVVVTGCWAGCALLFAAPGQEGSPGRLLTAAVAAGAITCVALLLGGEPLLYPARPRSAVQPFAGALALGLLLWGWLSGDRRRAHLLLVLATMAYAALLGAELLRSPSPVMDVWQIETEAAHVLLNGQNPYREIYGDVYEGAGVAGYGYPMRYIYLPGLLLHLAPAVWVGADIRWVSVLAMCGGFLLFARLVRGCSPGGGYRHPLALAAAAAVIFWFQPGQPFLLEQAWPEALILFYVALAFRAWRGHPVLAGAALVLALSLKQTTWFLLPFLVGLAVRERRWRMMTLVAVGVTCLLLPFLVWSPHHFVQNVLVDLLQKAPRSDSLSWSSLAQGGTGAALLWVSGVGWVAYGAGWLGLASHLSRSGDRDLTLAALKWAILSLFAFFLFLKQSFFNYYYLIAGLLALYVCLAGRDEEEGAP